MTNSREPSPEMEQAQRSFNKVAVNWMYPVVALVVGNAAVGQYLGNTAGSVMFIPVVIAIAVWLYFLWRSWHRMWTVSRQEKAPSRAQDNSNGGHVT